MKYPTKQDKQDIIIIFISVTIIGLLAFGYALYKGADLFTTN